MTKDEYYLLLGKYTHAKEAHSKASQESRQVYRELQSWVNELHISRINEQRAAHGHALIDQLLESKRLEVYWESEETQSKRALDGHTSSPAE